MIMYNTLSVFAMVEPKKVPVEVRLENKIPALAQKDLGNALLKTRDRGRSISGEGDVPFRVFLDQVGHAINDLGSIAGCEESPWEARIECEIGIPGRTKSDE